MGYALRLWLPLAALSLLAACPAAAASARAQTAAQQEAATVLREAADLHDGRGVRTGRELTDALRELALGVRHLRGDQRQRALALLARPDDGDLDAPAEERFETGLPVARQCSTSFCVHYVQAGDDAATAVQAGAVLVEAETVRAFENGTLGWREPRSDGDLGGDRRVDIYLKELGARSLFGWAATDPGQDTQAQYSYLVLDNDFDPAQYGGVPPLDSLRVSLAHEYGHVLQYGYDVTADGWHYESSAVWLEQRMYPAIDDWLRFVDDGRNGGGWRSLTELPLTAFDHPDDQPRNAKPYGGVVFNQFLASRYGARGDALQRRTWERSDGLSRASTDAYDRAIKDTAGPGLAGDFAAFAAVAAEWRLPSAGFPLAERLPDVERLGSLRVDEAAVTSRMDHMTFSLYDVPETSAARIRLDASFPAGTYGAVALVAREGSSDAGRVTTRLAELPSGGTGGVTLDQPGSYIEGGGRITAVLVNADATHADYDLDRADWAWSRDRQAVTARVSSDSSAPSVSERTPGPDATRVSTRAQVRLKFSENVAGVDARSISLQGPDGRTVPAAVSYEPGSQTAILTPAAELSDTTRYTVRTTGAIVDDDATSVAAEEWSFTTLTRGPRAAVTVLSESRRAVRFAVRSSDRDRLRWTAKLVAGGRTVARRSGTVGPRARRVVTIRTRRHARARLVVELTDPQANRRRFDRALRLPR